MCFLNTSYQIVLNCKVRLSFSDKVFCRRQSVSAFCPIKSLQRIEPYNLITPLPRKSLLFHFSKSPTILVCQRRRVLFSTLFNFTELLYRNLVSWAGSVGLEPTTPRLTAECSADWATSQYKKTLQFTSTTPCVPYSRNSNLLLKVVHLRYCCIPLPSEGLGPSSVCSYLFTPVQ